MAFERPSLSEIIARVEADLQQRLGIGALLPRSVLKVIARVIAGVAHLLHGHLGFVVQQIIPDTATGENMARWASIFGLTRKPAAAARGFSVWTGVNGTLIPFGTLFQNGAGVQFKTSNNGTIAAGTVTILSIQIQPFGSIGNMATGTAIALLTPIAGISSQGTVNGGGLGFTTGADEETDEDLLARLLLETRTPPQGGAEIDYEIWALQVAGVTRAWTLPLHFGVGSVGLTFMRDDDVDPIPDAAEVQEVQDSVDVLRPVAVPLFTVFAPTPISLAFTIDLTTPPAAEDSADIQAAITANLTALLLEDAEPGGTLLISKIREAISTAEGETDHILTTPTVDQTVAAGEVSVMGVITFV